MAHIPTANGTAMTGATSLVKSLEAADVEVMFGLPAQHLDQGLQT